MKNNKKIIIITRHLRAGGAERVITQLANYLVRSNVSCKIITLQKTDCFYDLENNVEIIPIGQQSKNKLTNKLKTYTAIRKIIKKEQPTKVLSMPEEVGVYVVLALLGIDIPVYVSERNNPWVMPDKKVTRVARRIAYHFVDKVIFQTEMAKSFFNKKVQEKSTVIMNPVDVSRIPEQYQGERTKEFVSIGRLEPQKNFELLIKSFSEFHKNHNDYTLTIYGEGSKRTELERLIKQLGMTEYINLPGRKNNVLELANPAKAFILSSDYEGMPNALLEAMCMGMPVISTDCPSGGPREMINNNENGLLVTVNDQQEMLRAMETIINSKVNEDIANKAFEIKNIFETNEIFEQWQKVILE